MLANQRRLGTLLFNWDMCVIIFSPSARADHNEPWFVVRFPRPNYVLHSPDVETKIVLLSNRIDRYRVAGSPGDLDGRLWAGVFPGRNPHPDACCQGHPHTNPYFDRYAKAHSSGQARHALPYALSQAQPDGDLNRYPRR